MKKILLVIGLFIGLHAAAQNPASLPKDTTLSLPEKSFETLWLTFEDHYAFFKLRHIDWKATYQEYRPQINAQTPDDSLYAIFTKMLAPFQDNHINLIVPHVKQFKSIKPSQFQKEFSSDSLVAAFWKMVDQALLQKGFSKLKYAGPEFNGRKLFCFTTASRTGYLRFNRCFVAQEADNIPDAKVAAKILDTVFAAFKNVNKIIIDVRDNIGGNDEFAYEVAGRFTSEKILGMTKRTRKGGYEDFDKAEKWYIEPKGKSKQFRSVTLLTNDKTVSAGDVFAMIMKALPGVKIIGTNTRGIYSDMYGFELPNKWLVSLSNQRYYNAQGVCYEGTGTPVDLVINNTKTDLKTNNDPVLQAAFK
ncbi:Tricorn protease C1 domain-containing protein [Mucilaginibacter pineti]|uniref:Tricorn protease C1 domain-containing protein n=1 Tax=Mucilaginibacter pineti TaxID=1391627 RepID=A0A1G7NMT0_9SPHI|nr:S41 family peptidase [Mucilaginibacter pineti]SDF75395.1 Tricorn protease C1 domain-containing protein [Mucilaginibacter pineti]